MSRREETDPSSPTGPVGTPELHSALGEANGDYAQVRCMLKEVSAGRIRTRYHRGIGETDIAKAFKIH